MKIEIEPTPSENLQRMKSRLPIAKLFSFLLCSFGATAVFGATIIWDGGDGTGTAIGAATNWVGDVSPNSAAGDICQWDGTVPGNLFLTATTANGLFNNGTPGVSFYIAAGHTGSWNLSSLILGGSANIALNGITIDSGAGAFSLGDGTANVLNIILRPSSSGGPPISPIHVWANNSATAATINPNVRWQSGGGNPHVVQIDGTGDWIVNSTLCMANGPATFFVKSNTGTWYWSANSIAGAAPSGGIGSPINIEGGRLVLTATTTLLGTQRITNNATLQYNASGSQTHSGPINGVGQLVVSAGTLTLSSSQSDFSGSVVLTNGGLLVAGGTQFTGGTGPLGTNGTIFFNGGTLQFSAANTFDYSPRFSSAANQAFSINSGGQNVTFNSPLASSGGSLTKLGSGTLTLAASNTYSGTTTVGAGKLILQGTSGTGAIVVSNSTTLGVNQGGTQIAPSTLTVGTSSSATLEFNNVSSTTTAAIAVAGAISAGGPITVNVNSGAFTIGQDYPLFSWGSGSTPAVTLGTLTGAGGYLTNISSTISLHITSLAFTWSGLTDGNWDTTTANNWKVNGVSQIFANGSTALFDDTATGETNVILNAAVSPSSTTVNSSAKTYSITSSGANLIGGTGALTKNGNSVLTLSGGVNTFSGATTIGGGTLSVGALANGGAASDIGASGSAAANLVLNGGTLLYTGGAQESDRLFTLGTGNGTITSSGSGPLALTNAGVVALSGTGPRTLTLGGISLDDNTLAAVIGDNGGATAIAKTGTGKWVLTGNNANSGTVTISAGTLQVGNGGASGSLGTGNVVDNGTLSFNTSSTLTNGTITGTGAVTLEGSGTIVLPGNNTYSGATTINAGTLQIGNGGASGTLNSGASIVNNGLLIYDSTSTVNLGGLFGGGIGGTGNVLVRKGTLQALGANSYSGWTQIDPGATFQPSFGNQGALASSVVTNNGTLLLSRQDNAMFTYGGNIVGTGSVSKIANNGNNGDVTLTGQHTYTGGTYILGGMIIFGDNSTVGAGSFVGNVFLTNDYAHNQFGAPPNDFVPATLTFNRPDDFVFPGNIVGEGFVTLTGSGVVTLTGNNNYTNRGTAATTTINAGTLVVGNGGTSGAIGNGDTVNNSTLVFNRSDSVTIGRVISGSGSLVQNGTGTLLLNGVNTYTGSTTVSNGTFGGSGTLAGPVTLLAGTKLAPGASVGTLTVNSDLTIGGNLAIELNKSLTPSNDYVVVTGTLTCSGTGTVTVTNLGPALAVGDKFTLFSQALPNGNTLSIVPPAGVTFTNELALDGSITVLTAPPTTATNPTNITATVSGGGTTLDLAWPADHLGWILQAQTNSLNVGLRAASNFWFDVPGSAAITNTTVSLDKTQPTVFYRLRSP